LYKISEVQNSFDHSFDDIRKHQENELAGINERIKIIDNKLGKITKLLLKIPGVGEDEDEDCSQESSRVANLPVSSEKLVELGEK